MSAIAFPDVEPAAVTWRQFAAAGVFSDPLAGSAQVVARQGERWGAVQEFDNLTGDDRASVDAWLAECRGPVSTMRVFDWTRQAPRAGNFTEAAELFTAPGTAGSWSTVGGGLLDSGHLLRLRRTAAGSGAVHATQSLSLVSGASYALRGFYREGSNATGQAIAGTTQGASDLLSHDISPDAGAWFSDVFTADATANWLGFRLLTAAQHETAYFGWLSCSRCALVAGASQTGQALALDALPASVSTLASRGDLLEVSGELHELALDLHADATGAGVAYLATPLRAAPADNEPVIFYRPGANMRLQATGYSRSDRGAGPILGTVSSFDVELIEAL